MHRFESCAYVLGQCMYPLNVDTCTVSMYVSNVCMHRFESFAYVLYVLCLRMYCVHKCEPCAEATSPSPTTSSSSSSFSSLSFHMLFFVTTLRKKGIQGEGHLGKFPSNPRDVTFFIPSSLNTPVFPLFLSSVTHHTRCVHRV